MTHKLRVSEVMYDASYFHYVLLFSLSLKREGEKKKKKKNETQHLTTSYEVKSITFGYSKKFIQ